MSSADGTENLGSDSVSHFVPAPGPRPVRIAAIEPSTDRRLAECLLAVQHESYRIEAELIGVDTIPQLRETIDGLLASGLEWIAAFEASAGPGSTDVLGALAWSGGGEVLEIERLVVSPAQFRRGIARKLVAEAIALAAGRSIVVTTGRDNPPARRLYETTGFLHLGDVEVAPGVNLARYGRRA